MCCHKKLPAINVAGRVYSDTRRTSRCVWSPYGIGMCSGRVLNGTGEGCPPFYPVISSPCIQKRCAAVVTSLSASNELHMIVCIQMFFVQKNFRLPDCIHCRPNAMRSPLLVPCPLSLVPIYRLLYMFVCIVNLLSCFSSLAVCLFSHASMSYPCLRVHALYALRSFSFFPCRTVHCFCISPLLLHVPYPAPRSGKGMGSEERYRSFPINLQLLSVCFYVQNSTSIILPCHELHSVAPSLRIPIIYNYYAW